MSNSKLIIVGAWILAMGWSIFFWTTQTYKLQQEYGPQNTALVPGAIDDGQAQATAQAATQNEGQAQNPDSGYFYPNRSLSFYPGGGLSGEQATNDFKFSYFYLGATRDAVRAACQNAGGIIGGIWPNSIANPPGFPVCYFQSDNFTDGYYPIYWPAQ